MLLNRITPLYKPSLKTIIRYKSTKLLDIPFLHETKTIYNPIKSAFNDKGYLRKKFTPGLYKDPPVSSTSGSIHSDTIPRSFMSPDDPRRGLPRLDSWSVMKTKAENERDHRKYHLKPEDITEIQKLRLSGEFSISQIAKKFEVTPKFISMVSVGSKSKKRDSAVSSVRDVRLKQKRDSIQLERRKRRQLAKSFP